VCVVLETLLDTSLQMLRNIPALALILRVILWFGIDETAKLFLVAVGVFFPIYLNTFHGICSSTRGWSKWRAGTPVGLGLVHHVILPGALPSVLVGLRCSLGLMWVLLICIHHRGPRSARTCGRRRCLPVVAASASCSSASSSKKIMLPAQCAHSATPLSSTTGRPTWPDSISSLAASHWRRCLRSPRPALTS
jgi:hypothetical protein